MAEESEIQEVATPTNDKSISVSNDSDLAWNYKWDEKLCKTTLKLFKPTVYTPPILDLPDRDPEKYYVCPVEKCKKTFDKSSRSEFRIHLKRHLPESEKPFKCDQPTCTRAFVRIDELTVHKRSHTGEKPYECEQCGKRFTRNYRLHKHISTHFKNLSSQSEEQCSDSDAAIDSDSDDSSSNSIIPTDFDGLVKREMDSETDPESETDVGDHQHGMEEVKVEPEKITETFLPTFYSTYPHGQIKNTETEKHVGGGNSLNEACGLKTNNTSSQSIFSAILEEHGKLGIRTGTDEYEHAIKLEDSVKMVIGTDTTDGYYVGFGYDDKCEKKHIKEDNTTSQPILPAILEGHAKQENVEYEYPIKLEDIVKKEIDMDATDGYNGGFEEGAESKLPIKIEPEMNGENYLPDDFYSSDEPTSMSAAIHRLAFTFIETNHQFSQGYPYDIKQIKEEPEVVAQRNFSDFYSSDDPNSMTPDNHRLGYPIQSYNIKTESKPAIDIKSKSKLTKNNRSKSKPTKIIDSKAKSRNKNKLKSKPVVKPYKCSVEGCDRAFKVPYGLKRHSWVHTKVKTFECQLCKKLFLRKDHLGKHMRVHNRVPIVKSLSSP